MTYVLLCPPLKLLKNSKIFNYNIGIKSCQAWRIPPPVSQRTVEMLTCFPATSDVHRLKFTDERSQEILIAGNIWGLQRAQCSSCWLRLQIILIITNTAGMWVPAHTGFQFTRNMNPWIHVRRGTITTKCRRKVRRFKCSHAKSRRNIAGASVVSRCVLKGVCEKL